MIPPESVQLGTILEFSRTFDSRKITKRMVIVEDPSSTLWKDNGIWVRLLGKAIGEIEGAWEVEFHGKRLNCMREKHLLTKEKIDEMTHIGQLTEEEINEMKDAEAYAERQRYFGI